MLLCAHGDWNQQLFSTTQESWVKPQSEVLDEEEIMVKL
jgi:hypothetical protein